MAKILQLLKSIPQTFNSFHESLIKRDSSHKKPIFVIFVSAVSLLVMHFVVLSNTTQSVISGYIVSKFTALVPYRPLLEGGVWALGCVFFYFFFPAALIKIYFKESLKDYGFTFKGYLKHFKWYFLLFIPVFLMVILVSLQPSFQFKYPFYKEVRGIPDLLVWEFFYGLQFVALEFFFRGFMVHGLKEKIGAYSVFLMVIPYMMIHYQKPFLEATGAIVAGTVLGFLSLGTKSIFGGATIHIFVAFSMDVMALFRKGFF